MSRVRDKALSVILAVTIVMTFMPIVGAPAKADDDWTVTASVSVDAVDVSLDETGRFPLWYGDVATLKVNVEGDDSNLDYTWQQIIESEDGDLEWSNIAGAENESEYITWELTTDTEFYCQVSDDDGRTDCVYFSIKIAEPWGIESTSIKGDTLEDIDTEAYESDGVFYDEGYGWYGGSLNLSATISHEDGVNLSDYEISYEWHKMKWDEDAEDWGDWVWSDETCVDSGILEPGENKVTYTINVIEDDFAPYYLRLVDNKGRIQESEFSISGDTPWAFEEGDKYYYIAPGDVQELSPEIQWRKGTEELDRDDFTFTYEWKQVDGYEEDENGYEIPNSYVTLPGESDTYPWKAQEPGEYQVVVTVTDNYGHQRDAGFIITVDEELTKAEEVLKMIEDLPDASELTLQDKEDVEEAKKAYESMMANGTTKQKEHLDHYLIDKLDAAVAKIQKLQAEDAIDKAEKAQDEADKAKKAAETAMKTPGQAAVDAADKAKKAAETAVEKATAAEEAAKKAVEAANKLQEKEDDEWTSDEEREAAEEAVKNAQEILKKATDAKKKAKDSLGAATKLLDQAKSDKEKESQGSNNNNGNSPANSDNKANNSGNNSGSNASNNGTGSNANATNPANQKGADGTALGKGASSVAAEKAITGMKSDGDPAGARFAPLMLRSVKQTKTSEKVTWKKVSGAKKYVLYGNKCGKAFKMKKIATTTKNSVNVKKIAGKKLKKKTYYKYIVVALDANDNVVSTSKVIHVATKGSKKAGNHKNVKVSKPKKAKVTVKKGKTTKIKAKAVTAKKIKAKKHRALAYESANASIATVSKKGVIKGVKKGKTKIYAYAQNGIAKAITVTVK